MAEYRRGQGSDALPQGAASSLNRLLPRGGADQAGYQDNTVPVEFARDSEPDVDEDDKGYSENLQVLLSPPDAGYRSSVMPKDRPNRVPRYVVRHLPTLMAAARQPDAPPAVRAIFNATLRYLESES